MKHIVILILMISLFSTMAQSEQKVILIGIDGLGGKYITKDNAPFIHSLFEQGSYTTEMQNVALTTSGPNWMSMLTGVNSNRHGIIDDNWYARKNKPCPFPTLFDLIDKKDSAIFYVGTVKSAMEKDILKSDSYNSHWFWTDRGALNTAIKQIIERQPVFTFLHFDYVDIFGHLFGYGSLPYNWMIKRTDSQVKKFTQLLKKNGLYDNTTLIITSDHGGIGRRHGGNTIEEKTTFFVINGQNITQNHKIQKPVRIFDIAPTIAHSLKIKRTFLDGRPILEAFK